MESTQFANNALSASISSLAGARRQPRSLRRILEKRILLDASAPADMSHAPATVDHSAAPADSDQNDGGNHQPHGPTMDQQQPESRNELVIIDMTIEDAQALVDDLVQQADEVTDRGDHLELQIGARDIALYTIDDSASVATVGDLLAEHGRTDALHLVTHGGAGGIDIGSDSLSLQTLQQFRGELQSWSGHFSSDADILLYGCNVSYSDTGEDFILQLSQLTGADIAASDDPTGHIARGGDWDLEYQRGPIETDILFSQLLQGEWDGLLAATASATVDADSEDFINETTDIAFAFDNSGADPGYGPFMDVVLGPGMTVESVSGFLGASYVEYTVVDGQWVDSSGNPVEYHPYDVNQTGAIPLPPVGPEGSHWYAIELPFGSFTPDQPAYEFVATILLDEAAGAEVGVPIPVYVRPGFMYGEDPLNNPDTDPPLVGPEITTNVTPTVMLVDKEALDGDGDNNSIGDDGETVTGPSEPVTWQVTVDIANLSTMDDLVITEQVPDNFYYQPGNVTVTDVNGNTLVEGIDYELTEPPEGATSDAELVVTMLTPVTGTTADNDLVITYTGYVPDVGADSDGDGNGDPIVINDGSNEAVRNTATASGSYQEQDVSDDDDAVITATATALQKDVALVEDNGTEGNTPGDRLRYTLTLQVSDYMQLEDLLLSDVLGDGLQVDENSITIELFYNGTTYGPAATGNATVTEDSGTGETTVSIDISQELIDQGISDGSLDGDLFADSSVDGTTTIVVTYEASIREHYLATGQAVDALDTIRNQATIDASAASANGEAIDNSSSEEIVIEGADSSKSVYAVNGSTDPDNLDEITVGDEVTFSVEVDLGTLDSNGVVITDYLPLPVFAAIAPSFVDTGEGTATPGANQWGFGPDTDFANWPDGYLTGDNISTSADAANNAITWTLDPVEQDDSAGGTVQLLFTVVVQDEPFTDGLALTNVASVTVNGTETTSTLDPNGVQVQILSPTISVSKGVISTDDPNGELDPTPPGPVTFDPAGSPGSGSQPWTGDITSQNLDTTPIDSDLSNVDAGDTVRFAIVVENSGGSDAFDVAISDTLPDGFEIPGGGLNLQVYTGNGTQVSYSGDLFSGGITLDDPSANEGALNEGRDPDTGPTTDGSNVIVITYDLVATDTVQPNQQIENTAQLEAYGGLDGGNDYTEGNSNINWQDDALVAIRENTVDKTLVGTSINSDNNANNEAVIGEVITYSVTLTIAEGETPSASLVDTLDTGLEFIGVTDIDFSGDISSTVDLNAIDGTVSGQQVTFDLGDLTNSNRDNTTAETITITYEVLVQNVTDNQSGDQLNNSARFFWDDTADGTDNPTGQGTASAENVAVIEPDLQVDKSLVDTPQPIDAGDTVTYEIVLSHSGFSDTDAFDVTFSDDLPTDLENFNLISVTHSTEGDITGDFEIVGNTLQTDPGFSFDLLQGETVTIQVSGEVVGTVAPETQISNTAIVDWQSIDGDDPNERTGTDGEGGALNDYESSDTLNLVTASVEVGKQIVSSSIIDDSNGVDEGVIGETLTYVSAFLVPEGGASLAEILDTLPEGVEFVSLDQVFVGANITFDNGNFTEPAEGSTGTISFGTADLLNAADGVQNENDIVAVVYTVRILNVDSNQAGTVLTNQAEFRFDANGNGDNTDDGSATASTDATVIEPQLQIDKSVNATEADNGDPVEYTITVTNPDDGTSTTAYDISFSDPLPDELSDITFTATLETDAGTTDVSGFFEIVGGELVLNPQAELDLAPGSVVTITVSGSLANALAGSSFDNTASVDWSSLDGDDANERTGADGEGGALDDYATSDNAPLSVPAPLIEKNLVSTSQNDDLNDNTEATIGEIVTFETVLTLPEAALIGQILDNYGPGFEFVDLVSVTASNPDAIQVDFDQITIIDDPGSNTVGLDFGTLVNTDTDNSTTETITFTYRLRVTDVAGNQDGTTLTNEAALNYDTNGDDVPDTTINDTATVDLVEPEVIVNKELLTPSPVLLGGTAQYQITVQLDPASGADAYDVHIEDALPPYLAGVENVQIDVTGGSPEVIDNSTDNLLLLDISVIDDSTVITITIDARVTSDPAAVGESTTNTTTVDWTSIEGDDDNERTGTDGEGGALDDYAVSDPATAAITAFDLSITKDDGGIDEANPASPGDTITYTFEYANAGPADATNVVITETLPDYVTFDAAANPDWTLDGDTLTYTVGDLAAGASGTATLTVEIVNPVPAGADETTNTVTIESEDGADPTPEDNTDDDVSPIVAAPDYVIDKIENFDDPVHPGDAISWTFEVSNVGNQDGTGVVVTDQLPDTDVFTDFVASDDGVVDLAAGTVTWEIGDLAAGDSLTLTLSANVAVEGLPAQIPPQENAVEVTDDGNNGPDPTPDNNRDVEPIEVEFVDLTVDKIENFDDPVHPGDSVNWTIEVTNEGNTTSTGVVVTDTLPDGDVFTGFVASDGGEVDLAAGTVTWTLDELAVGETATFSLSAVVRDNVPTAIPPQENSVSVTDDGTHGLDPTPENNTDNEPLVVEYVDLVIDKDDGGIAVTPTDSYVYTLNYQNSGTATAEGVVITETLPPNTTFDPANSTPGWVQDGDTFTFEVGSLGAGERGSIQFAVIVDFPLDPVITGTQNTATITDDGSSGPDQNPADNTDTESTEIRAQPQVDNITLSNLHWQMEIPERPEREHEPEMYGRLVSRETEQVTANLQGSRSGHHFDPAFGTVDGAYYPNDWSPVFDELSGYWLSPSKPVEGGGDKESPLQLDSDFGGYRAESLFGTFGKALISAADNDGENAVQRQLDEIGKDFDSAGVSPVLSALAKIAAADTNR